MNDRRRHPVAVTEFGLRSTPVSRLINRPPEQDAIRIPPPLAPGDTVAVVSPAGPVERSALEGGEAFLAARGYRVRRGRYALSRRGYLAGTDRQRLHDLNRAIADPEVRAVIFTRGGYGTTRLLPSLEIGPLAQSPKIILGYSDLTVLLNHLTRTARLATYLGPMVASDMNGGLRGATLSSFRHLLETGGQGMVKLHRRPGRAAAGARSGFLRTGRVTAPLAGGCLSMLVSTLGTPYQADLQGRILFLEEVNEPAYRIDRMLTQLQQAGLLERLAGVVVGRLHRCDTRSPGGGGTRRLLADLLPSHCPVYFGFPSGHGPGKVILPLGLPLTLDSSRGLIAFGGTVDHPGL